MSYDTKAILLTIEQWLTELAKPYLWFIQDNHNKLLAQHRSMTGSNCYLMGGKLIGPGGKHPGKIEGRLKPLDPSLHVLHYEWLDQFRQHEEEWVKAMQVLRTVFAKAKNWQDVRDMIPDFVLRSFPAQGLMALSRTRPDLFAGSKDDPNYPKERADREVHWDTKLLDLYEQAAPSINFYVGYKLL